MAPNLLNAKQVSELLACSAKTVYSWAELGAIPCIKIGVGRKSLLRFDEQDILVWLEEWKHKTLTRYNHVNVETVAGARKGA
ncbi:MAG: helix-turn-helix domain-containing protein [Dissulfurispiraceae bacterium]